MPRLKNYAYLSLALLVLLPSAALATDISIDSTCVQGTCPPPSGTSDAVGISPAPGSASGSSSMNIFVGSDEYSVAWTYSATYANPGGSTISVDPTVTYIGGSPTATADNVTFDLFQSYYDNTPGSWAGNYGETVPLSLSAGVGSGSFVTGQLCYDTACLAAETQNGVGSSTQSNSAPLDFGASDTANNLVAEYEFTFHFGAGTTNGAGGSSPASGVPEPAQLLPVGLALLGFACYHVVMRRRSSQIS